MREQPDTLSQSCEQCAPPYSKDRPDNKHCTLHKPGNLDDSERLNLGQERIYKALSVSKERHLIQMCSLTRENVL